MADEMDRAQQCELEERERHLLRALIRPRIPSHFFCEECNVPIPEARRLAVPGVCFCVTCQEIAELRNKHFRGTL